jgi:hypothetical protein
VSFRSNLLLVYLSLVTLVWNRWISGVFSLVLQSLGAKPRLEIYIIAGRLGLRLRMGAMALSSLILVRMTITLMLLGYMRQGRVWGTSLRILVIVRTLITDGVLWKLVGVVTRMILKTGIVSLSALVRCECFTLSICYRQLDIFPSLHMNHYIPPTTPSTLDCSLGSSSNTSPYFLENSGGSALDLPFASVSQFRSWDSGFGCDFGNTSTTSISLIPSKRSSDDIQYNEMSPSSGPIPCQCQPKLQHRSTLTTILRDLQDLQCTVIDLLMAVINGTGDFKSFRNALFTPENSNSLVGLLEKLIQDEKGRPIVSEWMFPHAICLVCDKIHKEMDAAKPDLRMYMADASPKFIEQWDIHTIMGPVVRNITPTLSSVLEAAGETKASCSKPKKANSKNRHTASLIIMSQLHYLRSRNSAKVQIGLGLQAWACGTSRQMIDVLHQTGLVVSYPSISSMVQALADRSIERAKAASLRPHALAYDNINISSSIFVEQGPNTMSKVQSGTFAVIYELLNARAEDMDVNPMIENLSRSSPLVVSDLQMTRHARQSYVSQTAVTIVRILTKYIKGFERQESDSILQHTPRQPLPPGHKTIFHPL